LRAKPRQVAAKPNDVQFFSWIKKMKKKNFFDLKGQSGGQRRWACFVRAVSAFSSQKF
jgi:hypothetical protein